MPRLYRLHVRPSGGEGDVSKAVAFCLENSVIGMGWPVPEDEVVRSSDLAWYEAAARTQYGEAGLSSVRRFAAEAKVGDLVWFRDLKGRYYLAELTDEWGYQYDDPAAIAADIVNYRPAKVTPVGLADAVPGGIVSCFGPGHTFQRISIQGMLGFSCRLLGLPQAEDGPMDLYGFMTPREIEDLVLVYLQANGWYVLSATRSRTTPHYECVLVSAAIGERAIVQVKSGNVHLPASDFRQTERAFLFAASGSYGEDLPGTVTVITREALAEFMESRPDLLPRSVAVWKALVGARVGEV
jgi:hypothetical protein